MDAKKLEMGVTHPTIHLDYYEWLGKLSDFERRFIEDHSKSFKDAHAIMMFAWERSREQLAKKAE